ncbi:MAG: tetratricopeptide repeat protein, partial [Planctomycetes bacterium]|nr:tetratricopeptide repeat protein [Planctomycetota bacterium]
MAKYLEDAAVAYQKAIQLDPQHSPAYLGLGRVYLARENYPEAIKAVQKAFDLKTLASELKLQGYLLLGKVYIFQQLFKEAADAYQEVLTLDAGSGPAYFGLAQVYLEQGNYPEAIKFAQKARSHSIKPKLSFQTQLVLGKAYTAQNELEKALEAYQQAGEFESRHSQVYLGLGHVYLAQDKYAEAIKEAQKALDLNPQETEALILRGKIYVKQDLLSEA